MSEKMKVYTRSGDKGMTSLVSGKRVSKSDVRLNTYGELDELNSFLGFAISNQKTLSQEECSLLSKIQRELFVSGSLLATESEKREKLKLPALDLALTTELEKSMDKFNEKLPALTHFILPGGCLESTSFNLCRVVCRRVERSLVLMESELPGEVPAEIIIFINRLSDYFFVLGRWLNLKVNMAEVIWKGRA